MVTEHIKIDDEVIDKGDPYEIMDPVERKVTTDGEQKYTESLAPFSREQRYLLAVLWYIAAVNNGGHEQFYFNPEGIVWQNALAGFKALGIDRAAKIVEESVSRMGGKPSLDRATRQGQLTTYKPNFGDRRSLFRTGSSREH